VCRAWWFPRTHRQERPWSRQRCWASPRSMIISWNPPSANSCGSGLATKFKRGGTCEPITYRSPCLPNHPRHSRPWQNQPKDVKVFGSVATIWTPRPSRARWFLDGEQRRMCCKVVRNEILRATKKGDEMAPFPRVWAHSDYLGRSTESMT
jgi:hypothetical protein